MKAALSTELIGTRGGKLGDMGNLGNLGGADGGARQE